MSIPANRVIPGVDQEVLSDVGTCGSRGVRAR
jgi:hypothetical protein